MKQAKSFRFYLISLIAALLAIVTVYNLPPVQQRVAWRVSGLTARIKYALSPPEKVVFFPQEASVEPVKTVPSIWATVSPAPASTRVIPSSVPSIASQTSTPIPKRLSLNGFQHEYQTWNNCGPATLSMALSFWGWEGSQHKCRPIARA